MAEDELPILPDDIIALIQSELPQDEWYKFNTISRRTRDTYHEQLGAIDGTSSMVLTKNDFLEGRLELIRRKPLTVRCVNWAYQSGRPVIIKYVLSQGWRNWGVALYGACRGGHVSLADEIYRTKFKRSFSNLYFIAACKSGNADMARWVLENIGQVDWNSIQSPKAMPTLKLNNSYYYVYASGNPDIFALAPQTDDPMAIASGFAGVCRYGDYKLVQDYMDTLSDEFIDTHYELWAAGITAAAERGYFDIVNCLLQASDTIFKDSNTTALHTARYTAARRGDESTFFTLEDLLEQRSGNRHVANAYIVNDAVAGGSIKILLYVLDNITTMKGPDNIDGAFKDAVRRGYTYIVTLLWDEYAGNAAWQKKYRKTILMAAANDGIQAIYDEWREQNEDLNIDIAEMATQGGQVKMLQHIIDTSRGTLEEKYESLIQLFPMACLSRNLAMVEYYLNMPNIGLYIEAGIKELRSLLRRRFKVNEVEDFIRSRFSVPVQPE